MAAKLLINSDVLCIDNGGYPVSLEVRKVYAVVPDDRADAREFVRVMKLAKIIFIHRSILYPSKCHPKLRKFCLPETLNVTVAHVRSIVNVELMGEESLNRRSRSVNSLKYLLGIQIPNLRFKMLRAVNREW